MNKQSARPDAIGVDGAPGGWVAATIGDGGRVDVQFLPLFDLVLELATEDDVIIVDMPIGLSHDGDRPVDALVRERLGPRRATFFPTPLRITLDLATWEEANTSSKELCGKGLSKQSWNLIPKIAEVDRCWDSTGAKQLREGHPETSFAEMAGSPLSTKKSQPDGRSERIALLERELGAGVRVALDQCPTRWLTDAIDAAALAWTANRVIDGEAIQLGGERDQAGRPMELCI